MTFQERQKSEDTEMKLILCSIAVCVTILAAIFSIKIYKFLFEIDILTLKDVSHVLI